MKSLRWWWAPPTAGLFGLWLYFYLTGFCFSACAYLDDSQLIRRAVHYNAGRMGIGPEEASIEDFLRQHPSCCAVHRGSETAGARYTTVELNYEVPKNDLIEGHEPFYKNYVEITACGLRGGMFGEGTKSLDSATVHR
jgi:hypothetical protein